MAKMAPGKRDTHFLIGIILFASVFFPTTGLIVAGAMSNTVKRLNIFAYVALIAAGVMTVDWFRRAGVMSVPDTSTALQLTFNIAAGAIFLCFGLFFAAVCGSLAFSKVMSGQRDEVRDAPRWAMIAVCLFFGGLVLTARQLDTNITLLETIVEKNEQELARLQEIASQIDSAQ
jgi:hypothetical protein